MINLRLIAIAAAVLALVGCKEIRIGGFIESAADPDAKATVAGNFQCTPNDEEVEPGFPPEGFAIADLKGQFQFRDHGYKYYLNGKEHKFAFHGTVETVTGVAFGPEEEACEVADEFFVELFGDPDGYCGPAELQPKPRPSDPHHGVDLVYRIAATDEGEPGPDAGDTVLVIVGESDGNGCPLQNGAGPGVVNGVIHYFNEGPLLGGNVQIPLSGGI